MSLLLLAVPLLPLLAGAAVAAFRRQEKMAGTWVTVAIAGSLAMLAALHGQRISLQARWFETGGRALEVGLQLNGLTWVAAVLVAGIALPVALYGINYMADDRHRSRFFAELALFVGAMLTLVLAGSLVLLFVAWEIVGLASWLLIGFHDRETAAAAAAAKAFLMTRIGDVGFLLAWLLVFAQLGTTDIDALLNAATGGALTPGFMRLLALLFFAAAVGKSAQLPLSMWLPDAMIAPTPVSALLHSATMAAAGVYLLLRLYPLLAAAPAARDVILVIGFLTAAVAALLATADMDLKRILAWSTVSQLGEMMIAIGLGAPLAAALHLVAHACFKSTLFLAAGAVDRYAGTRDLRRIGGLRRALPVAALCFLAGGLSLAGIQPFFTASSHDAILAAALRAGLPQALGILALLLLAGIYIGRAGTAVFAGMPHSPQTERGKVRRSMRAGMAILAIASMSITLMIAALPLLLPFGDDAGRSPMVHAAALLAGAAGLAIGAMHAWRHGPVPPFGRVAEALQRALVAATRVPPAAASHIARLLERIEHWLDAGAQALARLVPNPDGIERRLDDAAQALMRAVRTASQRSEQIERDAFGTGGDLLARGLQHGGKRIRALQTGKLYLYTLGLFAWTLLVLAAAMLMLWA